MESELKPWVIPTIVGVAAFGAGAVAGFLLGRRQKKNDAELLKQLEEDQTQLQFKFDEVSENLTRNLREVVIVTENLKGEGKSYLERIREIVTEPDPEEEQSSVRLIRADEIEWDWDVEKAHRTPDRPYILHRDEFFLKDEPNFSQTSIMWYNGDKILCDERDTPIYNPEEVVGEIIFGHGSGDPSIVYIRNERLEAEYEVILNDGYYQVEVLGSEIQKQMDHDDLRHSHGVRKFRLD